jgi:oligopeptide transport system substrate-binding protein
LFLALLLSPLVLTWLPATAAQDASGERVLRIEKSGYPDTLDPQLAYDTSQDMIIGLGFEGLTRIDDELNTVPAAAESWEFSPDGLILTFHLRDGLTYSDGTPLTAERFRYAIARTCDPQLDSFNSSLLFVIAGCEAFFTSLDAIEDGEAGTPGAADATAADAYETARANVGVRAVDDQTLELRLSRPAVYVPALASMAMFFPAKQELIEGRGEEWWRDSANLVGNGPFVIAELGNDTDRPSRMVFTANEHYWAGRPTLDRIQYVMANVDQTAEERLGAYRRGEVDMVWLGYDALAAVEADPELARDLVQLPRAATIHLALNVHKEPFTDPKVREAFAFGFDRAGFCRQIQHDFCEPTLSWIAPGTPGYVPTDAYAFDPQKAREALAASTYGGPETLPQVTWYYSADAGAEGLGSQMGAEWLAAQYRAVLGIELSLVAVADADWDPLFADPVAALQWSEQGWFQAYPDPQYWLSEVWTCRSGYNLFGYCNPDLDALLAQADAEPDPETRLALYQEAERLLIADVPSIFLFNWATALLVKPAVTNYASTAIDHWPGWTTPLTIDVVRST